MLLSSFVSSLCLVLSIQAGTPIFQYSTGDLVLTFRKTGFDLVGTVAASEFEADIGQASTYYNATPGTVINITQYSTSLLNSSFDNLNDMSWSLGGCVPAVGGYADSSIPVKTLWATSPWSLASLPGTVYKRYSATAQGTTAAKMTTILTDASYYSSLSGNAAFCTASTALVSESSGQAAGVSLGQLGNYDNTFNGFVENTTPPTFSTDGLPSKSDLYQLLPDTTGTQPAGAYLGYFQFNPDGSMVFYRLAGPPPTISVTVSGTTSTISFPTATGATYTLYYTNAAGVSSPISTWTKVSPNISGDGTVKSFQVTSTDANRFYSVQDH